MKKQLRIIVLILLALAALAYLGGIIWSGVASLQDDAEPKIPPIVTQAITVIGGVLATHTGAVFGIARYVGANSGFSAPIYKPQDWARLPARSQDNQEEPNLDVVQLAAVYVYLGSLILAVVFWGLDGGFSENAAEVLRTMSYTLVGLLGGLAAVTLNVDNAP